jgi:two-component system, NtrC family, sensor kinase
MRSMDRELSALKLLDRLGSQLRDAREPEQALRVGLRETHDFFEADQACVARLLPGQTHADLVLTRPNDGEWDLDALTRFIRHERPPVRPDVLIGPLRRRGAAWGALAVGRRHRPLDRDDGRLLVRITLALSSAIERIDRDRILDVRGRIDRKLMKMILPKDLFYQILDGIRSLTHYDHSSALFIRDEGKAALRLVAEQIAWTKAGSRRIGLRLPISDVVGAWLKSGRVYGFNRGAAGWEGWKGQPVTTLADLLDYNSDRAAGEAHTREASMLCAPLVTHDGLVGMLKIAALHPGQLTRYDADLVEHFRSHAAIAIQNLHRTESLRARVLAAERKHAMADLARSVSHDVNNALGAMLPLVQQLQEDVRGGSLRRDVVSDDLDHLQKSLQVCRRIFGGMLSFARGAARRTGHAQVRRAIETASAILKYGMGRSGIELVIDVPDDLPPAACSQSDLEQVVLNLLTNAREAMPNGGRITVEARAASGQVELSVIDSGCGILAQHLPRVLEPFFTTKPHGNGLGLSICRSIIWEVDGTIEVKSSPGSGTRIDIALPVPEAASQLQHA